MKTAYTVNDGVMTVTPREAGFIELSSQSLIETYHRACPEVQSYGLQWYTGQGEALARNVARETGVTFHEAAAVVAVCSPNTNWSMQTRYTAAAVRHLLNGGSVTDAPACTLYRNNLEKARRVLLMGDFSVVSGPKVGPFYRNLVGDYSVVTVDVWAIRAVVGRDANVEPWTKGRPHRLLQAAYHLAAERLGLPVAQVQAVVWTIVRDGKAHQLALGLAA